MSMGVYIKGMDMPEKMTTLTIFPNGYVAIYDAKDSFIGETKAFPVPPHGRLIDADALMELYADTDDLQLANMSVPIAVIRQNIMDASTIIPAEPTKEETE